MEQETKTPKVDSSFEKRLSNMSEAEIMAEFEEEYLKLQQKYKCTHVARSQIGIMRIGK